MLRQAGVVLGFPACAPAVGVGRGVIMSSRLPVQVPGIPVRGGHIRSAGVPRCLGVPRCKSRMLPGQYAGIVDAGAGAAAINPGDPASAPVPQVEVLWLTMLMMPLLLLAKTGVPGTGASLKTTNLEMHWGA
jgi:hypothetical protein